MSDKAWYDDGLRFQCTQCGNCCTGPPGYVFFTDDEAAKMADYLGLSVANFTRQHTHRVQQKQSLNETRTEHGYDCVFLKRDELGKALCSVYPVRPTQCRTWPFWNENLKSDKAWQRSGRNCPGMGQGKLYPVEHIRIQRDKIPDL